MVTLACQLVCSALAVVVIWMVLIITVQVGVLLWRVNHEEVEENGE